MLFGALTSQDLAQCGGLFKVSSADTPDDSNPLLASPLARIFAQWLSLVFMVAAQLGVAREVKPPLCVALIWQCR